jgi:divalent metal cation (Fe/Co/Zn/Cd) transporter/predicted transcriptional regulator
LSRLRYFVYEIYYKERRSDSSREQGIDASVECETLVKNGLAKCNSNRTYELTEEGNRKASTIIGRMEERSRKIEKDLLETSSAARNTIFINFFLAVMKLSSGLISGSVSLIADGVDATTDTISAFLVWLGIKVHKEFLSTVLVIFMLFVAAFSVGSEAVRRIITAIISTLTPISHVDLVIVVEFIAILTAIFLFIYQRHIGRDNNNLTIVSQSVDSKNHIMIGSAVIISAVFSIYGIYYVDAIVGIFISLGILRDAIGLSREALSYYEGEDTDLSKYKTAFGDYMKLNHYESFQFWIMFAIHEKGINTKEGLIKSLENAFKARYILVLSELKLTPHEQFDYRKNFSEIVNPLKDLELIIKHENEYTLTENCVKHFDRISHDFEYYDVKFSDSFLLKISDEK